MKLIVVALTETQWNNSLVREAIDAATSSARRIKKQIDLKRERKRLIASHHCLENYAIQLKNKTNSFEFMGETSYYFIEALRQLYQGVVHPFVIKDNVNRFINLWKSQDRYKHSGKIQTGFIVLTSPFEDDSHFQHPENVTPPVTQNQIGLIKSPPFRSNGLTGNLEYLEKAFNELTKILHTRQSLSIGYTSSGSEYPGFSHEIFTQVIRLFLYNPEPLSGLKGFFQKFGFGPKKEPILLPIVYGDGSISKKPFPLLFLLPIDRPTRNRPIHLGLVSTRHAESIDKVIDMYLLRNNEIDSRARDTFAEQESYAFEKAYNFFLELLKHESVEIHLYHTGLEPAVVGTYRAVVEILKKHRRRLVVIPRLYRGRDTFAEAAAWY